MGRKLYVGNLPFTSNENDLISVFSEHGTVMSARVVIDRDTGRSKGFGFVEMGSEDEAQRAVQVLNGAQFMGRPLTVNEARPREYDSSRMRSSRPEGLLRY